MKYLFILLKSVRMTSKQEYLIAIYLFSPYLTNSFFFFFLNSAGLYATCTLGEISLAKYNLVVS